MKLQKYVTKSTTNRHIRYRYRYIYLIFKNVLQLHTVLSLFCSFPVPANQLLSDFFYLHIYSTVLFTVNHFIGTGRYLYEWRNSSLLEKKTGLKCPTGNLEHETPSCKKDRRNTEWSLNYTHSWAQLTNNVASANR